MKTHSNMSGLRNDVWKLNTLIYEAQMLHLRSRHSVCMWSRFWRFLLPQNIRHEAINMLNNILWTLFWNHCADVKNFSKVADTAERNVVFLNHQCLQVD
jgi:hypothetical protein